MIVIDRPKFKFLRNGRTILIPNDGKHRTGRTYKLRISGQRRARWEIRILAIEKNQLRIQLTGDDKPRLLAAHSEYGYTDDPHRAMPGEPEAVSYDEQQRITRHANDINAYRNLIIKGAESLALEATQAERRQLRNLTRIASNLICGTATAA